MKKEARVEETRRRTAEKAKEKEGKPEEERKEGEPEGEHKEGKPEEEHKEDKPDEGKKKGEPEESTKPKPKAKKKGLFARLFSKDDEEEVEVIPRSKIRDDLFDVEEPDEEVQEETPELTQATQDFAWIHQALFHRENRNENLTLIASDEVDKIKGLSAEEKQAKMQEMIDSGEMKTYSDSLKPGQNIVISRTISRIHELAKELGVDLVDENGPVPIQLLLEEVSGRLAVRDGVRETMAEIGKEAAKGPIEPKTESKDSEGR